MEAHRVAALPVTAKASPFGGHPRHSPHDPSPPPIPHSRRVCDAPGRRVPRRPSLL